MRILLVNKFHYLKGGSEKYYFELGELLKEKGHEVAFFSMEHEKNVETSCKEYFVKPIDLNTGSKLKAFDVIYSKANKKKMEEALDDFKPDIVHLNNFQRQLSSSIIKPIKERNIPIVFTAHDMQAICPASAMLYNGEICEECIKYGYKKCIEKSCIKDSKLKSILGVYENRYYKRHKIYQKIDCIITPSNFMQKQLDKGNLKYKAIETIPNFVITKEEINQVKDEGYAFFFGRLSIEKGIFNLIKSIKDIENGKLYIAGDGPEKENIIKYIEENKLSNKVKLVGYLKQDKIREYIKNAKFIVVPSIWYENCPYSILETMEIGKPIIGTRIGGIPELIKHNENGFLYDYTNVEELKKYMVKLFDNQDIVIKQSKKSRELFEQYYTDEVYYNKIINLYRKLVEEKQNV